MTHVVCLPCTV